MNAAFPIILSVLTVYAATCGLYSAEQDAPLWLSWPLPIWNRIAHDWRKPTPALRRPDYAKIARLERELGIGSPDEEPT